MKRSDIKNRSLNKIYSKGLSGIISTLLIIMLILVLIGGLWIVIKNFLLGQSELTSVQEEFFSENVGISAIKINEPIVSISLQNIGGEINVKEHKNKTDTITVVKTDIISVVDLSGSMTQCMGVSNTCCTSPLVGTSYDSGLDLCYGANTTKGVNCTLTCKGSLYFLGGRNNGQFSSYVWWTTPWTADSTIRNDLPDIGSNSKPAIFYKGSSWYMLAGNSNGEIRGFVWTGTGWISNYSINASLVDVGDNSAPFVFYKDSSLYLIIGEQTGIFYGYTWNGINWIANSTIINNLADVGTYSTPFVFYKDSSWYLLSGNNAGTFNGYVWNGAQWVSNSTIINNLADVGTYSTPFVFYKDSSWYLISGEYDGVFNGYVWNGAQWVSNSTIINNLADVGTYSTPFVFYKNSTWIDRLTPTKQANKELVNTVLSASNENKVGFVAYSTDVINTASRDLTSNGVLLNNTIDAWQPSLSTCICCGINNASDRLNLQSDDKISKKIIVMSDGEANVECTRQNTGDSMQDAIYSSCNATTALENLTVHAIGAGEGVNEATLTSIATCGGGKYYSAINTSELVEVYKQVAEEATRTYKSKNTFNYLVIKFYNATKSYNEKITDIPQVLIVKNYQFDLTGKLEGEIIKIEIYPIIISDSGEEVAGPIWDSWTKK